MLARAWRRPRKLRLSLDLSTNVRRLDASSVVQPQYVVMAMSVSHAFLIYDTLVGDQLGDVAYHFTVLVSFEGRGGRNAN